MKSGRAQLAPGTSQNTGSKCPAKQLNRLWSTKSSEVSAGGVKMELQMMGEEDKSRYCYFPGLWLVLPLFKIIFYSKKPGIYTLGTECLRVWAGRAENQKLQQVTVINNS